MTTLRWLHLSDFHVGRDQYGRGRIYEIILDEISSKIEADGCPDFVFITGDIAHAGLGPQYEEFIAEFNLPLMERLSSQGAPRIYVVPGNHDIDRTNPRAIDMATLPKQFFAPSPEGQRAREQVTSGFESYIRAGLSDTGARWLESEEGVFTDVAEAGGLRVGVLGVNTAWLAQGPSDKGRLTPGRTLVERGLQAIEDCDLRFVLGHHPPDWFEHEECTLITALFKQHRVIYLHGHLDKKNPFRSPEATALYLPLQAGVCFEPAPGDKWANRVLWCAADLDERKISVEPLKWVKEIKQWKLDDSAFPKKYRKENPTRYEFPLPGTAETQPPEGWVLITKRELDKYRRDLTEPELVSFFNGRLPNWEFALTPRIRRRPLVRQLVSEFNASFHSGGVGVALLLGPGGEGKSTMLQQIVCDLVNDGPGWNVLWHQSVNTPLPVGAVLALAETSAAWLIASDDAHLIMQNVLDVVKEFHSMPGAKNIQFLLSSRDTDWIAAGGYRHNSEWSAFTTSFREAQIGLTDEDAKLIVEAWNECGQAGMLSLYGLSTEQAAAELFKAAQMEAARSGDYEGEGAFLGAMLEKRFGPAGLRAHVQSILERLNEIDAPGGKLLDAFNYIAAVHSIDHDSRPQLSKQILARTLGCQPRDVRREVVGPLGREAAVIPIGELILTRHKKIAETALEIIKEHPFDVELGDLYDPLLRAARAVFEDHRDTPIREWDYLASYFFKKGGAANKAIGLRLAEILVEIASNNANFRTQLGSLLRDSRRLQESFDLFEDSPEEVRDDRSIYVEWSVSAKALRRYDLTVWLAGVAVADDVAMRPPGEEKSKISLRHLAEAFINLFEADGAPVYNEAAMSATQLGLMIRVRPRTVPTEQSLKECKRKLKQMGAKEVTPDVAVRLLPAGIIEAWENRTEELPPWVKPAAELTFEGLKTLLGIPRT